MAGLTEPSTQGGPFVSFRQSRFFIRRESGATVSSSGSRETKSGSARCFNTSQNLTSNDLTQRSVMANQLTCGCGAPASRFEPAGSSGFLAPSVFPPSPTLPPIEARLQRQIDRLAAIREQLQALDREWPSASAPFAVSRPACGEFLLHPDVCRFRRGLSALAGACAALAVETQARLDRVRPGLERLRGLAREVEEVAHGHP